MESTIRSLAMLSVFRGCGFGVLAVVTGMIGFAFDLAACLRFGGMGMLLMSLILVLKARRASFHPYKRTEVWIMLDPEQRPPEMLASRLIAEARQAALYRFGYLSAIAAGVLLGSAELVYILRAL